MTAIRHRDYDALLSEATEQLIHDTRYQATRRQTIAAVVHATIRVRERYGATDLDLLPDDERVSLVIGLARQELGAAINSADLVQRASRSDISSPAPRPTKDLTR